MSVEKLGTGQTKGFLRGKSLVLEKSSVEGSYTIRMLTENFPTFCRSETNIESQEKLVNCIAIFAKGILLRHLYGWTLICDFG